MFNNKPLTIYEAMKEIRAKRWLLPPRHKVFSWSTEKIIKLFDSLMRERPIDSFEFGKVNKESVSEFRFNEFLLEHHQPNKRRHYQKANVSNSDEIFVVMEGQQRLSALYIGTMGSLVDELPDQHTEKEQICSRKRLYLNLLRPTFYPAFMLDFKFLTDNEAKKNDDYHHWFKVGDMIEEQDPLFVMDYLIKNFEKGDPENEKFELANGFLTRLKCMLHVFTPIHWSGISNWPDGYPDFQRL